MSEENTRSPSLGAASAGTSFIPCALPREWRRVGQPSSSSPLTSDVNTSSDLGFEARL